MYFNNDEKTRVIIGEAAMHLALNEQEIDVAALVRQLGLMVRRTTSPERQAAIHEACDWLNTFRELGSQHIAALNWDIMGLDEPEHHAERDNVVTLEQRPRNKS